MDNGYSNLFVSLCSYCCICFLSSHVVAVKYVKYILERTIYEKECIYCIRNDDCDVSSGIVVIDNASKYPTERKDYSL